MFTPTARRRNDARLGQPFVLIMLDPSCQVLHAPANWSADRLRMKRSVKTVSEAFCARRYRLVEAAAGAVADAVLDPRIWSICCSIGITVERMCRLRLHSTTRPITRRGGASLCWTAAMARTSMASFTTASSRAADRRAPRLRSDSYRTPRAWTRLVAVALFVGSSTTTGHDGDGRSTPPTAVATSFSPGDLLEADDGL